MSLSLVAHDPSVAEDGDTSPTELGRSLKSGALPAGPTA